MTDLTSIDAVRLCADRGFVNTFTISSGVVCYNRTTLGSEVVYICEDGFHQDGAATRVRVPEWWCVEWQYTSVLTRSRRAQRYTYSNRTNLAQGI